MKPARNKSKARHDPTEGLPLLRHHAAGIDVGSREHYVAVPPGRDSRPVQKFGSFTADLHRMAGWLKACGIKTVVMQATGVYWVGLFEENGWKNKPPLSTSNSFQHKEFPNEFLESEVAWVPVPKVVGPWPVAWLLLSIFVVGFLALPTWTEHNNITKLTSACDTQCVPRW